MTRPRSAHTLRLRRLGNCLALIDSTLKMERRAAADGISFRRRLSLLAMARADLARAQSLAGEHAASGRQS